MEKLFSDAAFLKALEAQRAKIKGRTMTMEEVAKHKSLQDMYIVIRGVVYDVTQYAEVHPGGRLVLLRNSGQDGTAKFDGEKHSKEAVMQLPRYMVADLADGGGGGGGGADVEAQQKLNAEQERMKLLAQQEQQRQEQIRQKQLLAAQQEQAARQEALRKQQEQEHLRAQQEALRRQQEEALRRQQEQQLALQRQQEQQQALRRQQEEALRQQQEQERLRAAQQEVLRQQKLQQEEALRRQQEQQLALQKQQEQQQALQRQQEQEALARQQLRQQQQLQSPLVEPGGGSPSGKRNGLASEEVLSFLPNIEDLLEPDGATSRANSAAQQLSTPSLPDHPHEDRRAVGAAVLRQRSLQAMGTPDGKPGAADAAPATGAVNFVSSFDSTMEAAAQAHSPPSQGKAGGLASPTRGAISAGAEPRIASIKDESMDRGKDITCDSTASDTGDPLQPHRAKAQGIPLAEVQKHNKASDCWIIIKGMVYDVTKFLKDHPGGAEELIEGAGTDCTGEFSSVHPPSVWIDLEKWYVGKLLADPGNLQAAKHTRRVRGAPALKKGVLLQCPLQLKYKISPNSYIMRFGLPSNSHVLGLHVGGHIRIEASIGGEEVSRQYTPVSAGETAGYFDLLIKVYKPSPQFPLGGKMSQHLEALNVGDSIDVSGPRGQFKYLGRGRFCVGEEEPRRVESFGFVCGGTGITPAYQIIQAILSDPEDKTQCWLLFSNETEEDILMKKELDSLMHKHDGQFMTWYTLTRGKRPDGWGYSVGRIDEWMITMFLPPPDEESIITVCGPDSMVHTTCVPALLEIGHERSNIHLF